MEAILGNRPVKAWKISHEPSDLDWVQQNFRRHRFFWMKEMGGMFRAPSSSFLGGNGIYGEVGDILVLDEQNHFIIVSEKKFRKQYKAIIE